jgi:hypothetical protein
MLTSKDIANLLEQIVVLLSNFCILKLSSFVCRMPGSVRPMDESLLCCIVAQVNLLRVAISAVVMIVEGVLYRSV